MADKAIEVLLDERRSCPPPKEFKKLANLKSASVYNTARKNPQAFWAKAAKELHWFKPWKKVHEWKSPWAKWFIGGKIKASFNCLDRHVNSGRKNKAAIILEGEPGDGGGLTYPEVWRESKKIANQLKKLGVKKRKGAIFGGMKRWPRRRCGASRKKWTAKTCCTFSTPVARRVNPRESCTPRAVILPESLSPTSGSST